jgi:hypothetical protein
MWLNFLMKVFYVIFLISLLITILYKGWFMVLQCKKCGDVDKIIDDQIKAIKGEK